MASPAANPTVRNGTRTPESPISWKDSDLMYRHGSVIRPAAERAPGRASTRPAGPIRSAVRARTSRAAVAAPSTAASTTEIRPNQTGAGTRAASAGPAEPDGTPGRARLRA